jgi:hypothetical protein
MDYVRSLLFTHQLREEQRNNDKQRSFLGASRRYIADSKTQELIPFPYQSDLTIYGKDVMDLTVLGLRSI